MGFRYRKRIRIFSGLSVNLSNSGLSTSIGRPGATINLGGKRGARITVAIPGTGLSYSESAGASPLRPSSGPLESHGDTSRVQGLLILLSAVAVVALIAWSVT